MEWLDDGLILATLHDDFSSGSDISVGFNTELQFVIKLHVWDNPDYEKNGYCKYAIIEKDDAYKLSKVLCSSLTGLPEAFCNKFEGFIKEFNSTNSDIISYYYSILGFIEGYHIPYKEQTVKSTRY